jgi:hypothetical protein
MVILHARWENMPASKIKPGSAKNFTRTIGLHVSVAISDTPRLAAGLFDDPKNPGRTAFGMRP